MMAIVSFLEGLAIAFVSFLAGLAIAFWLWHRWEQYCGEEMDRRLEIRKYTERRDLG